MKTKPKRLSYLKMSDKVQKTARPLLEKGLPLWTTYLNHIVENHGISINTFRKMMKEDVADIDAQIAEFRRKQEEMHARELEKRRRLRIK